MKIIREQPRMESMPRNTFLNRQDLKLHIPHQAILQSFVKMTCFAIPIMTISSLCWMQDRPAVENFMIQNWSFWLFEGCHGCHQTSHLRSCPFKVWSLLTTQLLLKVQSKKPLNYNFNLLIRIKLNNQVYNYPAGNCLSLDVQWMLPGSKIDRLFWRLHS